MCIAHSPSPIEWPSVEVQKGVGAKGGGPDVAAAGGGVGVKEWAAIGAAAAATTGAVAAPPAGGAVAATNGDVAVAAPPAGGAVAATSDAVATLSADGAAAALVKPHISRPPCAVEAVFSKVQIEHAHAELSLLASPLPLDLPLLPARPPSATPGASTSFADGDTSSAEGLNAEDSHEAFSLLASDPPVSAPTSGPVIDWL